MTYLISIIIPIYNGEKYIERCLNSVINQSIKFENLEVICVNDNSTDSSSEILDNYCKKYENIVLINLDKNSGHPGRPRNIGIKASSADYIMFMDQDDFYEKKCCEILYNNIINNSVEIVSGQWYKLINNVKIASKPLKKEIKVKNIFEMPEILGFPSFVWVKIFKKTLLEKNKIFFPVDGIEDVVFTTNALLNAEGIIFLKNDYVYTHYINSKSISRSKTFKYLNQLLIGYKNVLNLFEKFEYPNYYKYFIKMRLDYFLNTIIDSNLEKNEINLMTYELKKLSEIAKSSGVTIEGKLKILLNIMEINDLDNELFFLKYMKVSKQRAEDIKILKKKNKIIREKNKKFKEKILKYKKLSKKQAQDNKILKEKINNLVPIKNYLNYKIHNIKERLINKLKK